MSIRARLTLWFAVIIGLILIVSGMFFYSALRLWLEEQVKSNLRVYSTLVNAEVPQGLSQPIDYGAVRTSLPVFDEIASPGLYLQLVDASGDVVVKSESLGTQQLPLGTWPESSISCRWRSRWPQLIRLWPAPDCSWS
jgi:hypothetical protein